MPVNSSHNSSKRDKLPDWEKYFCNFAHNQFLLNEMVYRHEKIMKIFKDCRRDNLNALWSLEELYVADVKEESFANVLENRLKPIYDSAKTLGYAVWLSN